MARLMNKDTGKIIYDPDAKIERLNIPWNRDFRCYVISLSGGEFLTCTYEELKILREMLNYVLGKE